MLPYKSVGPVKDFRSIRAYGGWDAGRGCCARFDSAYGRGRTGISARGVIRLRFAERLFVAGALIAPSRSCRVSVLSSPALVRAQHARALPVFVAGSLLLHSWPLASTRRSWYGRRRSLGWRPRREWWDVLGLIRIIN
jgi:hypothetical protein